MRAAFVDDLGREVIESVSKVELIPSDAENKVFTVKITTPYHTVCVKEVGLSNMAFDAVYRSLLYKGYTDLTSYYHPENIVIQ